MTDDEAKKDGIDNVSPVHGVAGGQLEGPLRDEICLQPLISPERGVRQ